MKHHLVYWCGLVTICGAGLFACPSIQTVALNIDGVEVKEGSLRGQSFDLSVFGRGFGVDKISYDLSKQTGKAEKPAYQFRIVDQAGSILAFSEGSQIEVVSTTLMYVNFIVQTPLEYGSYDLELTLQGQNGEPLDTLRNGIVVMSDAPGDAGLPDRRTVDVGMRVDTGMMINPDATADAGVERADAASTSPLGPWLGDYRYRREVTLTNPSLDVAPGGLTLRIPIPHGDHVADGQARADASDVALYWNSQELAFQWENRAIPSSNDQSTRNELVMIAKLPETDPIPTGLLRQAVLVLYFGDQAASPNRTDNVFEFVERFDQDLDANNWGIYQWARVCPDRLGGANGSYCVGDSNQDPQRKTLASPNTNLAETTPTNVIYEASFWLAGSMEGDRDLIYFAYGSDTEQMSFPGTTLPDAADYIENPPLDTVAFQEIDSSLRIVRGWKLPGSPGQSWTRSRARFSLDRENPSFHFRFISADGINEPRANTNVAVDDVMLRRALEPDFEVSLGPVETRR